MLITFFLILILSFFVALSSMKDFNVPDEINKLIKGKNIKGKIVFFKNKVVHYRSKKN